MFQYYVIEIQQFANGEYGHLVHYAWDADADQARLKGESKYHQVLSAAAVSALPSHAAILISSDGFPIMHQCYKHAVPEPEETPEAGNTDEPEELEEQNETPEEES